MPITSSAKKALRQSKKRQAHNLIYRVKIKDLTKKALLFFRQKKSKELAELIPALYKTLDKSSKVGIIKKNTAARKKSRIAKKLNILITPQK